MSLRFRKNKGPETLEDKVRKIDPDLADGVASMSTDELKNRIVKISQVDEQFEAARRDDQDLKSLQEQLNVARETYSVPLKANKLRRKLILSVLKERGDKS